MTIEFKICRDPQMLEQYYALREECFRAELGIPDFNGSEEEQDRNGHIFLAIEDGRCIAGARIASTVALRSQVHQLKVERDYCCMWERLVFHPTMRKIQLMRDFCARLVKASRNAGYHHAMILSSLRNARFYRQCHTAIGVAFQIHRQIPHCTQGTFAGLEHYLSVATLGNAEPTSIQVPIRALG